MCRGDICMGDICRDAINRASTNTNHPQIRYNDRLQMRFIY